MNAKTARRVPAVLVLLAALVLLVRPLFRPPETHHVPPAGEHAGHSGPIDPLTGTVLAADVVLVVVLGVRLVRHRRSG